MKSTLTNLERSESKVVNAKSISARKWRQGYLFRKTIFGKLKETLRALFFVVFTSSIVAQFDLLFDSGME